VAAISAPLILAAAATATTIPVTNTNDNLVGSLRQAIQDANSGDTIVFQIPTSQLGYNGSTGVFTIGLTSNELVIGKNLTIDGGYQKIVIQRASGSFRIFNITAGTVNLANLTIANGTQPSGAGIVSSGNLTLRNCTLYGNSTGGSEGAYGGAISSTVGSLQVSSCTFTANTAVPGGSAISTGSGNTTIANSTIFGNSGNNAVLRQGSGTVTVRNTIIAGNTSGDVSGTFISGGYNFIGNGNGSSGFGLSGSHDQVGTPGNFANPQLGPLQDNGGPTSTMKPLAGSPVIDQGDSGGITTDQRGFPRPADQPGTPNAGDGSDIGAVEVGLPQTGPTFTVTTTAERYDGSCTTDDCTLAEALTAANANADANTVNFAPGVTGQITTDALTPTGLQISNPVTINGPGARMLVIGGESFGRLFNVSAANVFISGLTLANGYRETADGGSIYNSGGLTLTDCMLVGNASVNSGNGGAISNVSGATLALVRCTLENNEAGQFGGAVFNDGTFSATNCTFKGNRAFRGGAIITRFNGGLSSATLRNCTITGNTATSTGGGTGDGGGGYYAEGGPQQEHIANTIIALNTNSVNPDVRGQFTSDGHNLIGKPGSSSSGFGVNGDIVGTNTTGANPQFNSYGNNGGPTDTYSLLSTSTAINNGDNNFAPPTDQRGYLRSGVSDIGAYEFNGTLPVLKITSITRLANGHISLQGFGIPNTTHTIQAASDPSAGSFTFLGSATSNAVGALLYDDPDAVDLTRRFYRLTFP